jgi:hypothetical protein
MKVRRGFVSNSSSSSFITDFSNVEDCLIYMLDNYLQNSSDDYRIEKLTYSTCIKAGGSYLSNFPKTFVFSKLGF